MEVIFDGVARHAPRTAGEGLCDRLFDLPTYSSTSSPKIVLSSLPSGEIRPHTCSFCFWSESRRSEIEP